MITDKTPQPSSQGSSLIDEKTDAFPTSSGPPLLLTPPTDVYARFKPWRRRLIAFTMGLGVLTVSLGMQCFLSAIPRMAQDLGTTQRTINNCLAGYNVILGFGPLIFAPLAAFYGRPPVLLASLRLFTLGSIALGFCKTVPQLAGTLILQGTGSVTAWSLGAPVVGDMYPPEQRARGIGFFYTVGTIGSAISPAITGLFVQYTPGSWRNMCWLLTALGGTTFICQLLFVPDTAHKPSPYKVKRAETGRRWIFEWEALNFVRCLEMLKDVKILCLAVYSSVAQYGSFTLMVPLTYTLAPRYDITNVAIIGCFFLALGFGDFIGGYTAGWLSDWTLMHYTRKHAVTAPSKTIDSATSSPEMRPVNLPSTPHSGSDAATHDAKPKDSEIRPEDRLRTMWISGLILYPGILIALGWLMETGAGGIPPIVVLLFLFGISVMMCMVPANTFILDLAGTRGSDAMSAALAIRLMFSAGASSSIIPLIDATSVGWANTVSALIALVGFSLVLSAIHLGVRGRRKTSQA